MKSLYGLLLAVCIALPACSAENSSPAAASPAAEPDETPRATAPMQPDDEVPVLAQNDAPAPQAASTPVSAPAERPDIVAGRHYRVLTPTQPTSSSPDKVEVAEFFMYSCPHCMTLEPFIDDYIASKPGYVSFVRIPASFNKMARTHAKAYYMAESLGIVENIHSDFFHAFHVESKRLDSKDAVVNFFANHGVDRETAASAFTSFAVDTKVRQADNLGRRYGIDSVPTLVINGKYVTSASMTGSFNKLREVVDYLAAKEAAQL